MKKLFCLDASDSGFTLMEMLIVVTIIGILAAIVLPRFLTSSQSARKAAHKSERQTINSQLELYFFNFGAYPTAMTNEGWGSTDKDGNGKPDWQDYFPENVPVSCNQNVIWVIENGRVKTHDGHE